MTSNHRGPVFRKVNSTVDVSLATKIGRYRPCISLLFRATQKRLLRIGRPKIMIVFSERHEYITILAEPASALSGSRTIMSHGGIQLLHQKRTVYLKKRHNHRHQGECLMLSKLYPTHCCIPLSIKRTLNAFSC